MKDNHRGPDNPEEGLPGYGNRRAHARFLTLPPWSDQSLDTARKRAYSG